MNDGRVAMPPDEHRTMHERRTILIVSGNDHNSDRDWPVVLVCPISSGAQGSPLDVRLGAGVGGLKKKGWVRTTLVQPLAKSELQDCLHLSGIPSGLLLDVHGNITKYLSPNL